MNDPLVSVIVPVYNGERYLKDTLKSVIEQTYQNLEIIIIDDGSTDGTADFLQTSVDSRVRILNNPVNKGIVYTRNRGLEEAKGEFIAMVDSDDVLMPEKTAKQVEFLRNNPEFGMIGTWAKMIDENGNLMSQSWKLDAPPEMIPSIMLFKNYFLQSAVIYRKSCIDNYRFNEQFKLGEDYKIWLEISRDTKTWNLPEYLVYYRVHPRSISFDPELIREFDRMIFRDELRRLGIDATEGQLELHMHLRSDQPVQSMEQLRAIERWLLYLIEMNAGNRIYQADHFVQVVFNRWLKACFKAKRFHLLMFLKLLFSKLLVKYIGTTLRGRE